MIEFQSVWGWQPALYLFLGGVGAGAFIAAAILYLVDSEKNKKTALISSILAIACLGFGLLLLLTELTSPLRAMLLWQSFSNFGSWMCLGAWLLILAVVVFALNAAFLFGKPFKMEAEKQAGLAKITSGVGIVAGLGVAIYTGVLLMTAPGIPFWNTPLLPCLFTVSALDTGLAAVMIVMMLTRKDEQAHASIRVMELVVVALVVIEALVLGNFMGQALDGGNFASSIATDTSVLAAAASAERLMFGDLSGAFWGLFVGLGLVVPLVAAVASVALHGKATARWSSLLGAACALIGGCALRFLVLFAGAHADFVIDAVSRLLY